MIIKKFIAPTMTKALAKVKDEFGDRAVILKTRMNRKTGGVGDIEGKNVEVTAAMETPSQSRFDITAEPSCEPKGPATSSSKFPFEKMERLTEEITNIKKCLNEKSSFSTTDSFFGYLSTELLKAGRDLVAHNLSEQLSHEIVTNLARSEDALSIDAIEIRVRIKQKLSSMILPGEPIEIKDNGLTVVMFVGPTGSGKTSAVARIAMQYKVEKNGNIAGIISADNFRADSSQQIKSFCRILGCPCGIVYSPEELSMAIKSKSRGLLLIDTPGVNPRNDKEMDELQSLIKAAKPHEVHLVVSASTPAKDMVNMLESFGEFGTDKIFISKLDETEAPGGVITAVIGSGKRLSYVSCSREVPGQFGIANPESLAMAVLTGSPVKKGKPQWQMEAVGVWQ